MKVVVTGVCVMPLKVTCLLSVVVMLSFVEPIPDKVGDVALKADTDILPDRGRLAGELLRLLIVIISAIVSLLFS